MRLGALDLAIVAIFLVGSLLIGLWRSRSRSEDEYLLMNRTLSPIAFVLSIVCSWYGGILGVSEYAYNYGLSNWFVFGVPYYIHAVLFALFFARRARLTRGYSIPGQLEQTYGKPAARVAAIVIFFVTMPAAYLLMLGKLISWMTGWSYPLSLVLGTLVSTIYVYGGGLRSVVRTDIAQFAVMYGGFAAMLIWLGFQYGGMEFLQANVPAPLFTPTGGNGLAAVIVWYFIASTTLIEPLFYERVYAARSARMIVPCLLVAIGFWIVFDFMTTATGLYARALLPDLSDSAFSFPELAASILPVGLCGLFIAAMFAVVTSTVDSYMFLAASAFGRDIVWKSGGEFSRQGRDHLVRWGLVVTTVCAFLLALASDSIITLWHALGSISAPVLLLPTLTSWSPRWAFPRKYVLPAMLSSGLLALVWRIWPWAAGVQTYPGNIEPIYVGLLSSLLWYVSSKIAHSNYFRRPYFPASH